MCLDGVCKGRNLAPAGEELVSAGQRGSGQEVDWCECALKLTWTETNEAQLLSLDSEASL